MTNKSPNKPKIIAIVGPTASGKSKLAIKIAKENNIDLILASLKACIEEILTIHKRYKYFLLKYFDKII